MDFLEKTEIKAKANAKRAVEEYASASKQAAE